MLRQRKQKSNRAAGASAQRIPLSVTVACGHACGWGQPTVLDAQQRCKMRGDCRVTGVHWCVHETQACAAPCDSHQAFAGMGPGSPGRERRIREGTGRAPPRSTARLAANERGREGLTVGTGVGQPNGSTTPVQARAQRTTGGQHAWSELRARIVHAGGCVLRSCAPTETRPSCATILQVVHHPGEQMSRALRPRR